MNETCTYRICEKPANVDDLGPLRIWEGRNDGDELWHDSCRASKEANTAKITAQLAGLNLRPSRPGSKRYMRAM